MGKGKKVTINGVVYRIVSSSRKSLGRVTRGFRLQNYGRKLRGGKDWMNVTGSFKKSMSGMNDYIKRKRSAG